MSTVDNSSHLHALSSDTVAPGKASSPSLPDSALTPSALQNSDKLIEILAFSPSPNNLSFTERNTIMAKAEQYCFMATTLEGIEKTKIGDYLEDNFEKFVREIKKVSHPNRPYSLLHDSHRTYSELDFFNAIRHIDSMDQRAKLWQRMTDVYNLHTSQPTSEIEKQQLATLFFNSAYIEHTYERNRIIELGRHVTANPHEKNVFRFILANLSSMENAEDQADAARVLIGYSGSFSLEDQRHAVVGFRKFLPAKINHKAAVMLHDLLDTLYLDITIREIELTHRDFTERISNSPPVNSLRA